MKKKRNRQEQERQENGAEEDPLDAPTIEERIARYQQQGYTVKYADAFSDTVPVGQIIGTKADDNAKVVTVYKSVGPQPN